MFCLRSARQLCPSSSQWAYLQENWPAAVGVFTGILAKEAVVGTLDSLYSGIGGKAEEQAAVGEPAAKIEEQAQQQNEEEGFNLARSFGEAVASIGEGFGDIGAFFTDPLGISVESDLSDVALQAEEQEVSTGTIAAMNKLFDGELGAFAYLLMVLLYLPCGAAMGAIYREVGSGWAIFPALWTTAVGYSAATIVSIKPALSMLIRCIQQFVSPFALRSLSQSLQGLGSLQKETQTQKEDLPTAMLAKKS